MKQKYVIIWMVVIFFNLISAGQARWEYQNSQQSHKFTDAIHSQLSGKIRDVILKNISQFKDPQWVKQFQLDLKQPNGSKRKLKQMSAQNAQILFNIFKIKNPFCDKDNDGVIKGKQLKCLDKIWKYFVPSD